MKQTDLFGNEIIEKDNNYTRKIEIPIYKPINIKPHIFELVDKSKTIRLITEIKNSNISEDEKKFLIEAANRHNVFNYGKIADYYSHASKETQRLMERSALVIIDFNKAYESGYLKLANNIANTYLDTYEK